MWRASSEGVGLGEPGERGGEGSKGFPGVRIAADRGGGGGSGGPPSRAPSAAPLIHPPPSPPPARRAVAEHSPKLLFLTSPNNPDGSVISDADLEELLALPVLVVLDEAYIEFADAPSRIQ